MKKSSIIFLLLFFILIYGCSKSNYTNEVENTFSKIGKPVTGDWLIRSLSAEPATLNPILATDVYASIIDDFIYETLLQRDKKTFEMKPLLAYKWEISKNKLEYTFYLRKGIKWDDGVEFTADDVVFSYKCIMNPTVDAPHLRNYYRDIKNVIKLGKYKVKFIYKRPYFLALEICGGMPIVPEHIYKKGDFNTNPYNRKPIGTGPYKFEKWETGKEIILVRKNNYWGKKSYIDKIVFKIITDDTVRLQLLKRGDIDFAGLRPIQWVKQTRSAKFNTRVRKLKFYTPNYNFIGWNLRRVYFKDRDVREALTHLIDRKSILKNILYNLGKITTGPFYIYSKYYDKSIKPYKYNVRKAKELLAKAGWKDSNGDGVLDKDGIDFHFTFLIPAGSKFAEQLATIVKESFKKVGIIVDIKSLEWATFISQLDNRNFDAVTLGWSMGVEQDPYQIWHSSQAKKGSNFVGFKNKRVDELIEKGRREFDEKKRIAMYKEIHRILHREQPYTFLFSNMSLLGVSRRFQNTKVYNIYPGVDITEWWVPKSLQKYGLNK